MKGKPKAGYRVYKWEHMSTKEAAKYLGISYGYLRNMRHLMHTHNGPVYTMDKHYKSVCSYTKKDLDEWKQSYRSRK